MTSPLNSGCGKNEECVSENNANAKCKCIIPNSQVDGDKCECLEGSFVNGECLSMCETSDDCNGGKCVQLYDNEYKTCLCPIQKLGFIKTACSMKSKI